LSIGTYNPDDVLIGSPEDPERRQPSRSRGGYIHDLAELLWDRRRELGWWTLGGVVLAGLLWLVLPSKYESTARVLPSESTSPTSMLLAGSSLAGVGMSSLSMMPDLVSAKTVGSLCAVILRSDAVQDAIINRFDLRAVYRVRDYEKARTELSDRTVVNDDKKSGVLTWTVVDRDPKRAAAIANAYAEELDKVLQSLNTSAAHREREFLEQRIAVVRQDLEAAEKAVGEFSSKNSTLDIREQGKAAFEVAGKVEGEYLAAQAELRGLRQIYGPDHPRVKQQEARVADLRAAAARVGSTARDENSDLGFLSASRLPVVGATYADMLREVKIQEVVYETLVKQYEISKVEEVKETPRLRVIDDGKVASRRSSPKMLVLLPLCIWAGFAAGVIAIEVRYRWQRTKLDNPWKSLGMRVAEDLRKGYGRFVSDRIGHNEKVS
jgi:uncharacterized protein involved in exopolysaccharide biosynthesis